MTRSAILNRFIPPWKLATKENSRLYAILISGLLLRIVIYFFITPHEFCVDAYHHWQISFFSLKVGFPRFGFFYDPDAFVAMWMPLPHLVEMILLAFNSSIETIRWFNLILGSITTVLVFRLGKLLGDKRSGLMAALFYALFPTIAFIDTEALIEPLTIVFIISAFIKMYEGKDFQAGILWAAAYLCRIEIWPIGSIVLALTYILQYRSLNRLVGLLLGLFPPLLTYYIFYSWEGLEPLAWTITETSQYVGGLLSFLSNPLMIGIALIVSTAVFLYRHGWLIRQIIGRKEFSLVLFSGLLIVVYAQLFAIGGGEFYLKFVRFMTLNYPSLDYNFFRYTTVMLPVLFVSMAIPILKVKSHTMKKFLIILFTSSILLLTIPVAYFFQVQEATPISFMKPCDWIGKNYDGGTIVVDNQLVIYRLTDIWKIPAGKIPGSYYARDWSHMMEENVTMIIFTSQPWDGARILYNEIPHDNLTLIYSATVHGFFEPVQNSTFYVYQVKNH